MDQERMGQPDLISRLWVGLIARELFDEYLKAHKPEQAVGLVKFCERMGVTIPDSGAVLELLKDE